MKSLSKLVIFVALATLFHLSSGHDIHLRDRIMKAHERAKERLDPSESRVMEDIILGNILSAIKNGSDCFGNPPLDPFDYEENINLENLDLLGLALVDSLNVKGIHSTKLSEFIVHTFTFNLLRLSVVLNVTFPELTLDLDHYDLSGVVISIVPVDGDGSIQLNLQDVNVDLAFTLGTSENGSVILSTLSLHLAVGEVKLEAAGLFGGSRTNHVVNAAVSKLAPTVIEDLQETSGPEIVEQLRELINGLLTGSDGSPSSNDIVQCLIG